ncbi:alpha-catulin [Anarhichas minor]|uniref:alpha-catulin n=1 Tax=Anarhichas minor TaxID=65739 RepID=UPI003F73DCE9
MSSLFDHGLIRTAVVEQVVAPIASNLCHLVLLCDSAEEPEQFRQLEGAAQAVAKATGNMAAVASRQISDTEDEVFHMEMSSLLESVTVSGQHVLLAAQKLSIQPGLTEHREELITATQNVFLGVAKVLLVDDDALVRRVVAAADRVLESLSELGSAPDIKSLLKSFRVFSEALLFLNSLTVERANALRDPRQTKQLLDSLETLRRCISMLHTATCTTIKHPTSEQAKQAKRYILDKVHSTQESDSWDPKDNKIVQMTRKMADTLCYMTKYLKKKGPIPNKEAFVTAAKDVLSNCQSVTQFIRVIANHCLDKQCAVELSFIVEQILTITNQLSIISSVNAVTPGCKSSDEILVKNAQNLLQTVLRGVRAAETACITGLKQPEPNSDGAEATALCFQWRRKLEIHRAQQTSNPETDELGLRKTSTHPAAPSLAPPVGFK